MELKAKKNNNQYYLRDSRSNVGDRVMFWNKDSHGYGTNLDNLEVYTLTEAKQHFNHRDTDIPLLKSLVDDAAILSVDHQYLPKPYTGVIDHDAEYVAQIKGEYNGNDILFVGHDKNTYDYSKARYFKGDEIVVAGGFFTENKNIYLKSAIDDVSRRVLLLKDISHDMYLPNKSKINMSL